MLQKYKKQIDSATMAMSIIIPIFTLPQLIKIWGEQSASGVSLMTWSVYFLSTIIWTLYGFIQKDMKLIILNGLLIMINFGIVLGIIIYG